MDQPMTTTPDPEAIRHEVETDVYVPGEFRCAKYGFFLSQFKMSAVTGAIDERDDPGEKCPNDGSPLWRVTWKERALENGERAIEEIKRVNEVEGQIAAFIRGRNLNGEPFYREWPWYGTGNRSRGSEITKFADAAADAIARGEHRTTPLPQSDRDRVRAEVIEAAPRDGTRILARVLGEWIVVHFDALNPKGNPWRIPLCNAWFGDSVIDGWQPLVSPEMVKP